MMLKGALIVCVALLLCKCDAYLLPSPFYPGHQGSPFQMRYLDEPYQRTIFGQRFDPSVSEASSEVSEKEYGPESKESDTNYFVSTEKLSWYEARDSCKSKGMVLARPDTYAKHFDLINYVREHDLVPKDVYSGYWLGSHRSTDDGPWIWESIGQEVGLFGWLPGEPNGYKGENCLELKQSYRMGWNNYYCHELKRFICEKLPQTSESDKNTLVDTKDALHDEILKESLDGKEDDEKPLDVLFKTRQQKEFAENKGIPSISEISPSTTTNTEREALFNTRLQEFTRNKGIPSISEILPSTTTNTERDALFNTRLQEFARNKGIPSISESLPSTTTNTAREALFNTRLQEFARNKGIPSISEILPSTTTNTEREALFNTRLQEFTRNKGIPSISEILPSTTTNTEREAVFNTRLQEFARNKGIPSISEILPSTTTNTEREALFNTRLHEFARNKGIPSISEILPSTTTNTEREALFNTRLQEFTRNKGIPSISEIFPSTTTTTEREALPDVPEFNPEAIISEILPSTTTTTEREALPDIPEFNPEAIIFRDLGDDYYQYDSDYMESMDEDSSQNKDAYQRLQAYDFY